MMSREGVPVQTQQMVRIVGDESIATEWCAVDGTYQTLLLHGAGHSNIALVQTFREFLAQHGVGTVAFDFSGHGNSSGNKPNSLAKRLHEAHSALSLLNQRTDRMVIAFSMSGEIALRLTAMPENGIGTLVLFAPAVYDPAAFAVDFGPAFTEIIRQPQGFRKSAALAVLEAFHGHLVLVLPEHDEVIPKEVAPLLLEHARRTTRQTTIVLPNQPHATARRMSTDVDFARLCAQLVATAVQS